MDILVVATVLAGLIGQPTDDDDAVRLSNIEFHLKKVGPARIDAQLTNPNTFAVYHVVAECNFGDRHGHIIASNTVTFIDAVQAKATRNIQQFDVVGWPDGAWTAACTSLHAKRLPP